ncbi:alkaline phosphatase family protein [Leisingera aquaemixtae]|uniref:alkaline phosphatase D family protein n=1 Tax=Leisingera TaxID=191028 RepID=UPI001C96F6C6|nr:MULTISPECIES: alkaline phosphatase D family protein [Leisingera]MBY6065302.1 alkaline phosphatase family protein [Leisingera aquaemixtae]MCB4454480.1 alkaline phosphatase family protein [Leisingera sp. McT4-56]
MSSSTRTTSPVTGPILILDDLRDGRMHLAALFIAPKGTALPPVELDGGEAQPAPLAEYSTHTVLRARFSLPAGCPTAYQWNGTRFELAGGFGGDLRIAFASCNGEEHGDLDRDGDERNAMWARMGAEHRAAPFSLLLHGGDQVYADEVTGGHPLSQDWPERIPRDPAQEGLVSLHRHLRERFLQRYLAAYSTPEFAWIAARVPSLMQWDDHDICDGWGSLRRSRTYSPVGQTLFAAAREAALLFQHGCADGDLPARFADPEGTHLGWRVEAPGLRLLAPDLRSERSRRRVMARGGWRMMRAAAEQRFAGRSLILSSVPLLGPRLSLLELLMVLTPRMQKYEDDLRDQWQSRAHRASWRRMLRLTRDIAAHDGQQVTAISGEIHLATRGEMALGGGKVLHQLVASGIAHRAPPRAWARVLGLLSWLGDAPLAGHPIRIRKIPGQAGRYVAERNYLILERQGADWSASWELETSGRSAPLPL